MRDGCPFCDYEGPSEILARYMPESPEVYGYTFAITPINPVAPGHVLIVPELHVEDALEHYGVTAFTFRCAAEWAKTQGLAACNILTSVGEAATQTVKHLHVHVIPRHPQDGLILPWTRLG